MTGFEGAFDETGVCQGAQIIRDMPARTYHLDADGPRLSQSLATVCVNQSALHAWAKHPLLGAGPAYEVSTDDGTIIHSLILEPDSKDILEVDPSSIKTKGGDAAKAPFATAEGKAIKAAALAEGRIPMLSDVLGAFKYKALAVRQRFAAHPVTPLGFEDGHAEVVIYWSEETPSGPVRCRARLDYLQVLTSRIRIIDLKTTGSAHPRDLRSTAWRFGYDIQAAAYIRAVTAVYPDFAGRVEVVFAFAEIDKPYAVNPITMSGEFAALGEARWIRGRNRWAESLARDEWACYSGGALEPPPWAMAEEMGE